MFKKLWKILLFIVIIIFVLWPIVGPFLATFAAEAGMTTLASFFTVSAGALANLGGWGYLVSGAIGVGLAYVVDPDTTTEIIEDVGEAAGKVTDAVVGVVGGALSTVTNNIIPWVLGGAALLFIWKNRKSDPPGAEGSTASKADWDNATGTLEERKV